MPVGITQRLLYQGLYRFPGYRRQVVSENLDLALTHLDSAQRLDLTQAYYRHVAALAAEILAIRRMGAEDFAEAIVLQNVELVKQATDNFSRSVVFVLLHQGNWEWLLHGASQHLGITIDPIYQPLHSRTVDSYLLQQRGRFGATPVNVKDTGRYLLKNRRRPKAVAILADQCPTAAEPQRVTRFLGLDTAFKTGFVKVANVLDAALVFTSCHRSAAGRYEVRFHSIGEPPNQPSQEMEQVAAYAKLAEQAILKQPETWLWSHRRWKNLAA